MTDRELHELYRAFREAIGPSEEQMRAFREAIGPSEEQIRALREALGTSEEQIRAITPYKDQLGRLDLGLPVSKYLEEVNRKFEQQKQLLLAPYEEIRLSLERAIRPFSEIDVTYLQELYKQEFSHIEVALHGINTSIAEATFLGEVELGGGEEEERSREEAEAESPQEKAEEQLIEVVSAEVVTSLKRVDFVPLRLLDQALRFPELMRNLSALEFEQFVATLIDKLGFENVVITPRSGDQGRDIIAVKRVSGIPVLFAFECKRYGPDKPIGVELLRALLGTISHGPTKANKGILVTTSRFTSGARKFMLTEPSLDGKDFNGIVEWLGEYGRQTRRGATEQLAAPDN